MVNIEISCSFCSEVQGMEVERLDLLSYMQGEAADSCFPYLPAPERELLISGMCPKCWDRMVGIEEFDGEYPPSDSTL